MTNKIAVVCDDDGTMVRIARMVLTRQGFAVHEAGDGDAGLALIRAVCPSLVLLDLQMPGKDGVAVLTELQGMGHTGAYIIVLSAEDRDVIAARIRGLGASESMTKPFNPMEFSRKIEALVLDGKI